MPMPMENQNGIVMGIPADCFGTPPRYEEPTIITTTTTAEPLPCINPYEKLHPCLKWFIVTLFIFFILLISLAFSGFYLTYHQNRAPIIKIESIIPSNIASTNNTTISTNWHLTFSLENPNKYASIHYKKTRVSVSYRDKHLSSGYVKDFYQDEREEGRMNVDIFGLVMDLGEAKMNDVGERVFSLKLDAVVWLEVKYMKKYWQLLEANCGDVKVRPSMSLALDGSGRCNVNLQ